MAPDDVSPRLLAGGNPQIPKGDGEAPVRDYLAAMPDWKAPLGAHLHDLITTTVPDIAMFVKWNQPLYGPGPDQWVVSFRCFTRYVQVAFARGASLDPEPPKAGKDPNVRYLDIHQDDDVDDAQLTAWIAQAATLPADKV